MNILGPKHHSYIGAVLYTSQLSYYAEDKVFSGEASEIKQDIFGRLYADAYDAGFLLLNQKTGNAVPFYHVCTAKVEGEITEWRFRVCEDVARLNFELRGMEVVIFND